MTRLLFAALALACLCQPVMAKHYRVKPGNPAIVTCDQRGCSDWGMASAKPIPSRQSRQEKREARRIARGEAIAKAVGFGAVVERPARRPARLDRGASAAVGLTSAIVKPARYIAGRLICAINVGSALAERGIKGTGSALALSYLKWGQASGPVPGAVAVSTRRGGGHVAIVSRVVNGQVYVWNPSPRGRGWQEGPYRHRAIAYRVASQ